MDATGILLAVATIVKQLELFEKVDIFRTVKDMRDYREGMLSDAVRQCCFLARAPAFVYFDAIFSCIYF